MLEVGVIPAHGPTNLTAALEQVRLCRSYGFDSIWIEEHHDSGPYWPTPLLALAALAPELGDMGAGTSILIMPLHDPVHVAEQVAVLDQLTRGRFILGLGLGDNAEEFAAFRVPARKRGARFEEQLAIIRALWTGEPLTFHGEFYDLDDVRLKTLPHRPGGPAIWIGGWSPRQLERAARLGGAWLPGPVGTFSDVLERQQTYDRLVAELGGDPLARDRPLIRDVVLATSDQEAWALATETVLAAWRDTYVESDHVLVGRQTSGATITELRDLANDRLIVGDPDTVSAELSRCLEAIQGNRLIVRLKLPGLTPEQITATLHILGQDVLPQLRKDTSE